MTRYTRKQFLKTLYLALATDSRFDAIEGATRQGHDTIIAYPFDGPPIRITVSAVEEQVNQSKIGGIND